MEYRPQYLTDLMCVGSLHHPPTCMCESGSGCRFMADQVIGYFQDMAAYVLEAYAHLPEPPHPEVQQEVLRKAVLPGNAAEKPEICLLDERFKALAVGGHVRLAYTHTALCCLPLLIKLIKFGGNSTLGWTIRGLRFRVRCTRLTMYQQTVSSGLLALAACTIESLMCTALENV